MDAEKETMSSDNDQINLQNYEIQKKMFKGYQSNKNFWKYYTIMNISTGKIQMAMSLTKDLNSLSRLILINISREINIVFKINHPSILKFIGYSMTNFKNKSKPVIITEYPSKITLNQLLEYSNSSNEKKKNIFSQFTDTKKLIAIFGIASGMSYLHSHNIIHRNLNKNVIFFDDLLYPKISGFEYSYEFQNLNGKEVKIDFEKIETQAYLAPEVESRLEYSKSSDVFSFSEIIYMIVTNFNSIVYHKSEPLFSKTVAECYKNLIQRCWSKEPEKRPTFADIVNELKTNPEFLKAGKINVEEYHEYIQLIENEQMISFNNIKKKRPIDDILKDKTNTIHKSDLIKDYNYEYFGSDIKMLNYEIKYKTNNSYFNEEKLNHEIFKIYDKKNDSLYFTQIYFKEINKFYRNEIINFRRKLNIISQIRHPSIIGFVGFNNNPNPVIFTEHFYYNLLNEINWMSSYDYTQKLIIIYGIASGMAYLHKYGIIHRDLKTSNIYLDYFKHPKISGFDIAKEINNESTIKSKKIKGTPIYLAPETYLKNEYSKASDVYSFGFIIYEILMNQISFEKINTPNEIKQRIIINKERPPFKKFINENYRILIERCWSHEPENRPTFDQILIELKTNPAYLVEEMDKENYFEYIEFLDESSSILDSNKRVKFFDDIDSKILTFPEIGYNSELRNMHETETNDLSFNYNYFDLNNLIESGHAYMHFYEVCKLSNSVSFLVKEETPSEVYFQKFPKNELSELSKGQIINFCRELNIIPQLNHPSILKFIGFNPKKSDHPIIVLEYSSNGSLKNILEKENDCDESNIEWNDTKKLISIYGIALGMSYLHKHNIIHRDLKPDNIYYDNNFYPKISGFNIAIELKNEATHKSQKIKGTPMYLAPEIYLKKEYSKASDVYSFGLVMYQILTDKLKFDDFNSPKKIKQKIALNKERPPFLKPINKNYQLLIERCWSHEPNDRPTFDEILTELTNISSQIDKIEFQKYINYIENSNISFDTSKRISQYDFIIKQKLSNYKEIHTNINYFDIYDTEFDNVLCEYDFLNINNFEKMKLIHVDDYFKFYKIIDKTTGSIYLAKKSKERIDQIYVYFRNQFMNEINYLLKINHPLFAKFIGYSPYDFKNKPLSVLVTEIGSNGTLEDLIEIDIKNKSKTILNETKRLIIMYGIASAMSYLHSQDIFFG